MYDIGPGTPAWNTYEKALVAYARATRHDQKNRAYKSYTNYRDYMVRCLVRAGADKETIESWKAKLIADAKAGVVDQFGEWIG